MLSGSDKTANKHINPLNENTESQFAILEWEVKEHILFIIKQVE